MLQIRLKKVTPSEGGGVVKPLPVETVTVACPDHLVLANLPVAKGIGSATTSSIVKIVGRRSRRQLGERVHFCVRCDFPIAIYGRLNPCEHVFCLDCARSDSVCYLCDERVQKIQTIKLMEGIFICAAPHCLKSFLKRDEFESHIHTSHTNLLNPNAEKEDGNESECQSTKQPTASDSSVRAPPRPVFSPGSNPPLNNRDDKTRRQQPPPRAIMQPKPPIFGQVQNYQSDPQSDSNIPPGFAQGTPQLESSQQQQGLLPETQFPEYPPLNSVQPPNFAVPMNSNPVLAPPFGALPFPADASQQFYGGAPYGMMPRPDSLPEIGSEQASLLGFPPGTPGSGNYPPGYPQLWNAGPGGVPFEVQSGGHGIGPEGFANPYGQNPGGLPMISAPPILAGNKAMETVQGGNNAIDLRDGKGILAPQPMSLPLPPPPPPGPPPHSHLTQHKRGNYYTSDMGREGQGFGWSHDSRDSYGSSQD